MNRLQGKDLINIGIFTAIYFIVIFAAAVYWLYPYFHPAHQCDRSAGRRHPHDAVFLQIKSLVC